MPLAWKSMRRRWDVVVTSAHALGRSFGLEGVTHLSYVYSPARYLWFPQVDSRSNAVANVAQMPVRAVLKGLDKAATRRTTSLAAISATTQSRIRYVYGRESELIYPPVDTDFYSLDEPVERSGLLAVGRLIPYKRMDTAIGVAHRLGVPLTLVGTGPDGPRLERLAGELGADVRFIVDATDDDLRSLYRRSEALLFPGNEDFGIVPVEAQACGCPVVTAGVGGALETVVDGVTGVHGQTATVDDFTVATSIALESSFSALNCREQAERFSYSKFGIAVCRWIEATLVS